MKKLMVFLMILITLPMAFALGNNFNFTSKEGTVQINGSDVCIIETGQCMSSLAGGISYTAGSGIVVSGGVITATSINGTGTGGGNSNETLWAMFANLTQIMDNVTIYNMINGVTENDTDTWNSNISINNYLNTYYANLTQIMNNHTIYDMINAVSDNDTDTNNYINNDTLSNAISNTTIIHLVNISWVRNLISGLTGLVYDASTGQLTATAVNGTSNAMNNQTIANALLNTTIARTNTIMDNITILNYVTSNYITYYSSNESIINFVNDSGYIKDWNSSGYIKDWGSSSDTNETDRVEILVSYVGNQTTTECPTDQYAYSFYGNGTPKCRADSGAGASGVD